MYALASSGVVWAPAQISWQVVLAEGSDVRPGVGSAPAQISWQAQHFAACQGVGCTPWRRLASAGHRRRFHGRRSTLLLAIKGSDVRPGVVWRQLGTGAHLVAGTALCCLPRGRMYALASSGHRRSLRGRHSTLLLAKGSDVRPGVVWRRLGTGADFVAGAVLAKGSDVRPGVVWRRLGTGADFVAGAVLCCLPRGRMYALASSGVGWALAPHCCVGFLFFLLHLLARPPPSSSLLPPSSSLTTTSLTQHLSQQHLSQQQRHSDNIPHTTHNITHTTSLTTTSHAQQHTHATSLTQHRMPRGRMTTSLREHPTHNVSHTTAHTQHLSQKHLTHNSTHTTSVTQHRMPRCSLRGRRSTLLLAKGSDVRPGVVWRRLGTGADFVAGAVLCCLPRGRMCALASAGHRRRFRGRRSTLLLAKRSDVRPGVVWRRLGTGAQAQHFAACQGVGCTPWRRLASSGVGWAPAQFAWQAQYFATRQGVGCTRWRRLALAGHQHRFRGRRSTLLLAKGSDVRPGVVWRRLGTGADFVAGAALCSTLLFAKGSDVRPAGVVWRRLGTGADFVAGAALCCLPRGRMYALASSGVVWRRLGTGAVCVAGAVLCCTPRGRMYALASSGVGWAPAQISWQAQHFAACQGVGCTPWRRLASAGHRRRFRGRHSICGAGS